jgi:hypothetical protein
MSSALQEFDLAHQLWRLRHGRNLPDVEVELILRTIADNIRSYDTAVEVCSSHSPISSSLIFIPTAAAVILTSTYGRHTSAQLRAVSSARTCAASHRRNLQRVAAVSGKWWRPLPRYCLRLPSCPKDAFNSRLGRCFSPYSINFIFH